MEPCDGIKFVGRKILDVAYFGKKSVSEGHLEKVTLAYARATEPVSVGPRRRGDVFGERTPRKILSRVLRRASLNET